MSDLGMPYLMGLGTVEKCAQECKALGLDFVEINISFPACRLEELTSARLNALKERFGIYFTLHMDEEADPFAFNRAVRAAWLDTFRAALKLCREAEIPILNMHLPIGVYITLDGEKHYMFDACREEYMQNVLAFRAAVEAASAGSGVTVCLENTAGFLPHMRAAAEALLASPRFALTLDIGHEHASEGADSVLYARNRERIAHMHAHDTAGKRDHLPLGEGEIDLRQKLRLAVENGVRILVEVKTPESLRRSCARLTDYLPTTDEVRTRLLQRPVRVTVDRPLGSAHPRHPDIIYPVNYGFVKGVLAPDGCWQDAYVLGVSEPVRQFRGRVIAVIRRADDMEEKWIVAPEGVRFDPDEIMDQVRFVEQFFQSEVIPLM